MHVRLTLLFLCLLLLAATAPAQPITIGPNFGPTNGSTVNGETTHIDLINPATNNGTITSVKFDWAASPCAGAVKIKFVRRNRNDLTVFAESGPFSGSQANTVVPIAPVAVLAGDLIGITQLTSCGNPTVANPAPNTPGYVGFPGDPTGTFPLSGGAVHPNNMLAVMGSGTAGVGAAVPALGPSALVMLALVFAVTGYVAMRRTG